MKTKKLKNSDQQNEDNLDSSGDVQAKSPCKNDEKYVHICLNA